MGELLADLRAPWDSEHSHFPQTATQKCLGTGLGKTHCARRIACVICGPEELVPPSLSVCLREVVSRYLGFGS